MVGERSGNIDEMLESLSKFYEEEFDVVVDGLSTVIEPLMIVVVGGLIGSLVVALYLPIFSAGDLVGSPRLQSLRLVDPDRQLLDAKPGRLRDQRWSRRNG